MNIYILYRSGFSLTDSDLKQTELGIYKLSFYDKYIFEFVGECSSYNVDQIGGYKNIQLSKFKHSEIKNAGNFAYLELE